MGQATAIKKKVRLASTSNPPALDAIRQHRESLGWSVAKMARRLDISHETLQRIEGGETRPDADVLLYYQDHADIALNDWRMALHSLPL